MPRILTLTANLLAETTYTYESWAEGATQRAREESFQVGGKGINVTLMLSRLGMDSLAVCFPGGGTGARCRSWLEGKGIAHRAFPTSRETRTGAVVRAPGRAETTFLGTENIIDAEVIEACADFLNTQPAGDVLAICGSVPAWGQPDWLPLRRAITAWSLRGPLAIDTYGPPLADLAGLPAALVKINRKEFAGIAGVAQSELTESRMPILLQEVAEAKQARRWVVTDGPHPVWFCERGEQPGRIAPPPIREVSPTGSGDVMHAGILYALLARGLDLRAAVDFALPLAAANAAAPGVAEFDLAPFGLAGA